MESLKNKSLPRSQNCNLIINILLYNSKLLNSLLSYKIYKKRFYKLDLMKISASQNKEKLYHYLPDEANVTLGS